MIPSITLVTGGAGFIGRYLVNKLLTRSKQVRVLDLAPNEGVFPPEVEYIQGSIVDRETVSEAMQGVSELYHLAANPRLWAIDPHTFFTTNYEGTKIVLQEAELEQVSKIVYTSTEAILMGYRKRAGMISEETPLPDERDMPGPYTQSKLLADHVVQAAAANEMPIVLVYPTTPIGAGDINMTPPTQMIRDFLNGKTPAFMECQLNLIAVEDVAEGHILAMEHGQTGERYILGNQNIKLSEILKILEEGIQVPMPKVKIPYALALITARVGSLFSRFTGKEPVASLEGVRLARTPMLFDSSKALSNLGLPQRPVKEALLAAAQWLIQEGHVVLPRSK